MDHTSWPVDQQLKAINRSIKPVFAHIREGPKIPFTCMFMYRSSTRKDGQNMAATAMLRSPRAAATTVVIARPRATSRGEPLPLTLVPRRMNRVASLQHDQNVHEPLQQIIPSPLNSLLLNSTITLYPQPYEIGASEISSLCSSLWERSVHCAPFCKMSCFPFQKRNLI